MQGSILLGCAGCNMTKEEFREKERIRYRAYYAKNKEAINNRKKNNI